MTVIWSLNNCEAPSQKILLVKKKMKGNAVAFNLLQPNVFVIKLLFSSRSANILGQSIIQQK